MTDNDAAYAPILHSLACNSLGIKHLRIRPCRPRTNGKVERFIRTMLGSWAAAMRIHRGRRHFQRTRVESGPMRSRDPLANPAEAIQRVYAFAAYRLGPGADAEDVTSAVIERAIRYRSSYDSRRGEPLSWLIGIARTCINDLHRNRLQGLGNEAEPRDLAELESESLQRIDLASAVATLEPRDRELIALRYGADLGTREIAKLLETTTNAVDVALHRARTRLRDQLREAGYDDRRPSPPVASHVAPRLSAD